MQRSVTQRVTVRVHHMHMSASADMCALKFVPTAGFAPPHSSSLRRLLLSQILEVTMEVVQITLQEFVQNRTVEQIVVHHSVEVYLLPKELDEKVAKIACRRQWR